MYVTKNPIEIKLIRLIDMLVSILNNVVEANFYIKRPALKNPNSIKPGEDLERNWDSLNYYYTL